MKEQSLVAAIEELLTKYTEESELVVMEINITGIDLTTNAGRKSVKYKLSMTVRT